MRMDRLRRVADIWNWLPAFRAVAEYESIQKAAITLNVSPSALSRTVRLLEDATSATLFVRSATGLTLTTAGSELLRGTRDAMRRIDDVIAGDETTDGEQRTLAAASSGPVLARLLDRAMCVVVREHDGGRYRTSSVDEDAAAAELLRGNLDLALIEAGASCELPDDLTCERLGALEIALLAPPGHPLAARGDGALEAEVAAAKIVTLTSSPRQDGLGPAVATVGSVESAERLAAEGPFLALLPRVLVPETFRVVRSSTAQIDVAAIYRKPLEKEPPPLVRALLGAIRMVVAS